MIRFSVLSEKVINPLNEWKVEHLQFHGFYEYHFQTLAQWTSWLGRYISRYIIFENHRQEVKGSNIKFRQF